jgi:prolyl 4-hydroxylase
VAVDRFEPAVLLRYGFDDYFRPHLDTNRQVWQGEHSSRIATILIYLNHDFQGGETCFPLLGINTQPQSGRAIYWRYDHPDSSKNDRLLHSGEPVKSGTKHAICLFLRDQPFLGEQRQRMSY